MSQPAVPTGQQQSGTGPTPTPPANGPQPPAGDPQTFSQEDVARIATREKQQGRDAGVREILNAAGFQTAEELAAFVQAQRQAQEQQLTEEQRRAQQIEQQAEKNRQEAERIAREGRALRIRTALAAAGSAGDNQNDAAAILERDVPDGADDDAVTAAVEELRTRRPDMFTAPAAQAPAQTPSVLPGLQQPHQPPRGTPGEAGRARAAQRFGGNARTGASQ